MRAVPKPLTYRVSILTFVALIAGCVGSNNGKQADISALSQGLVRGQVRALDGSELTKLTVRAGDRSVETDAKGRFEIALAPGAEQRVFVDSKDFAGGEAVLALEESGKATVELEVMRMRTFKVPDAEKGGRFEDSDGFVIELPAESLRLPDGSTAKGEAEIRYAAIREPRLMRASPELRALDERGREVRLSSKGLVKVRFYQEQKPLHFKGKAQIALPLPPGIEAPAGKKLGAYHYDEQARRFKQEAEAVIDAEGKWVALVEKFSWWTAAEEIEETSCVSAALRVSEAETASGTLVTATGLDTLWRSAAVTNEHGRMCVEVPRDAGVALSAYWRDEGVEARWQLQTAVPEAAGACGGSSCLDLGAQALRLGEEGQGAAPDAGAAGAASDAGNTAEDAGASDAGSDAGMDASLPADGGATASGDASEAADAEPPGDGEAGSAAIPDSAYFSPYRQLEDSPFVGVVSPLYVEDFEDGALNALGLSDPDAEQGQHRLSSTFGAALVDSVDGDDGDPANGTCSKDEGTCNAWWANGSVTFEFDAEALDGLPTYAGGVWTDGSGEVGFEAFGPDGEVILSFVAPAGDGFPDGNFGGGTAEDRFFGVHFPAGISAMRFFNSGGIEVDHIQYGR